MWNLLAGCINGISYFHRNNIFLNNLTSKRILLNHEGIYKISDPGLF
jgi:serine/threonine protein kinase